MTEGAIAQQWTTTARGRLACGLNGHVTYGMNQVRPGTPALNSARGRPLIVRNKYRENKRVQQIIQRLFWKQVITNGKTDKPTTGVLPDKGKRDCTSIRTRSPEVRSAAVSATAPFLPAGTMMYFVPSHSWRG